MIPKPPHPHGNQSLADHVHSGFILVSQVTLQQKEQAMRNRKFGGRIKTTMLPVKGLLGLFKRPLQHRWVGFARPDIGKGLRKLSSQRLCRCLNLFPVVAPQFMHLLTDFDQAGPTEPAGPRQIGRREKGFFVRSH